MISRTEPHSFRSAYAGAVSGILRAGLFPALALLLFLVPSNARAESSTQRIFNSPAVATSALIEALKANDSRALGAVLGPDSEEVISSRDPVADATARADFLRRYTQMHRLEYDDSGRVLLYVGADNWPLPIPIVKSGDAW